MPNIHENRQNKKKNNEILPNAICSRPTGRYCRERATLHTDCSSRVRRDATGQASRCTPLSGPQTLPKKIIIASLQNATAVATHRFIQSIFVFSLPLCLFFFYLLFISLYFSLYSTLSLSHSLSSSLQLNLSSYNSKTEIGVKPFKRFKNVYCRA